MCELDKARRVGLRALLLAVAGLLMLMLVWSYVSPGSAAATVGEMGKQPNYPATRNLAPHNPLGGSPAWAVKSPETLVEINEQLEPSEHVLAKTGAGSEPVGSHVQGADGDVYLGAVYPELGQADPGVIGRYVPSSGLFSYVTLPTSPSNCTISEAKEELGCGMSLATGPKNTVWYAQYKQSDGLKNGTPVHDAYLGRIAVKELGAPITQYKLTQETSQPQDLIESGGSRMWFIQAFGTVASPIWNVAAARLNEAGKLEVSEFASPGKARGELVRGTGENVFLFQNLGTTPRVTRITPAGVETEISIGEGAHAQGPALGPDGAIWWVEREAKEIVRYLISTGKVTRYAEKESTGCSLERMVRGFGETMFAEEVCGSNLRLTVVATK